MLVVFVILNLSGVCLIMSPFWICNKAFFISPFFWTYDVLSFYYKEGADINKILKGVYFYEISIFGH